ncbi:MAG: hypothetical protein JWN04_6551 [Myxococcaceae bacterium]|nr:hypothetical protein [Myxococcaceae bacterium]
MTSTDLRSPFVPSGQGLVARSVLVAKEQVGFLRSLLEGEDGLAFLHGDGSGVVQLLTPVSQLAALDRLIADLQAEGLVVLLV